MCSVVKHVWVAPFQVCQIEQPLFFSNTDTNIGAAAKQTNNAARIVVAIAFTFKGCGSQARKKRTRDSPVRLVWDRTAVSIRYSVKSLLN